MVIRFADSSRFLNYLRCDLFVRCLASDSELFFEFWLYSLAEAEKSFRACDHYSPLLLKYSASHLELCTPALLGTVIQESQVICAFSLLILLFGE
jgi:hypothetical protein